MAQKVQTLFIDDLDDLDGSEADGTVRIGLDGTRLRDRPERRAHPATARRPRAVHQCGPLGWRQHPQSARSARKAPKAGPDSTEVREWAKAQGIEVEDRGRIPAELVVKFQAATGQ